MSDSHSSGDVFETFALRDLLARQGQGSIQPPASTNDALQKRTLVHTPSAPIQNTGSCQARLPKFFSTGTVLEGRYRIDSFLGMGGMCEVYKAYHLQLERPVALKMLRPLLLADQQCIERFHREAVAMSKLKHPNIVELYGFGYFESRFQSRPYMALEYIEGCTLGEIAARQRGNQLRREVALPIFFKICDALEHAHSKGIIHRDLKPSNIMISPDGQTVKVIDFGIAKVMAEPGENMSKLTQSGGTVGSVIYMSPEQCAGREIDPRTDIYSMGCLMYEMLAGAPPLSGDTPYATMHKHLYEMPKLKPILADEFGKVILCALAKDPARRPQSASDLKRALAANHRDRWGKPGR